MFIITLAFARWRSVPCIQVSITKTSIDSMLICRHTSTMVHTSTTQVASARLCPKLSIGRSVGRFVRSFGRSVGRLSKCSLFLLI